MDKSQLPFLSATELASLIKSREVSPVEATEAYLERIPQIDGKLNSYITVTADRAMADARQAEQEIVSGNYRGPMHGIPIGIKDQVYTKGILTTGGSTILKDFVPSEDATVVTKLNEAGAVLLGKLNMSEFAMGDAFEHPYGRPHNPWDLSRNAGTSSSGSSAATPNMPALQVRLSRRARRSTARYRRRSRPKPGSTRSAAKPSRATILAAPAGPMPRWPCARAITGGWRTSGERAAADCVGSCSRRL